MSHLLCGSFTMGIATDCCWGQFVLWCRDNYLQLNKTKELAVNFQFTVELLGQCAFTKEVGWIPDGLPK